MLASPDVNNTYNLRRKFVLPLDSLFLKRYMAQSVYTACTGTNYKIVPLTNLNKYVQYATSETEVYVYKHDCK